MATNRRPAAGEFHNLYRHGFARVALATPAVRIGDPRANAEATLALRLDDGKVGAIAFEGESCAICKASASMLTTNVKGKTRDEAEVLIREFRDMATGKLDVAAEPHHLGRLTVFGGVRDLPTRVKCAILPWHTLHAALNSAGSTSTEAEQDPMQAPIGDA